VPLDTFGCMMLEQHGEIFAVKAASHLGQLASQDAPRGRLRPSTFNTSKQVCIPSGSSMDRAVCLAVDALEETQLVIRRS
jgi:hypothetical protein